MNSAQEFFEKILSDTQMSYREICRRSGDRIKPQWITKLRKGDIKKPSAKYLKIFADAVGVPEAEMFNAVLGNKPKPTSFETKVLSNFFDAESWTAAEREDALKFLKIMTDGIRANRK